MRPRIVVLFLLFVLDRLIKNIMWFSPQVLPAGFLQPVLNSNIAFSLQLPGFSTRSLTILLVLIVLGFLMGVARLYYRRDPLVFWWALITIGALSNVLDRLALGSVLDYITIGSFPVFNLSDAYITIGISVLLYREVFLKGDKIAPAEQVGH